MKLAYPIVFLKPGREHSVKRRHHWIFSGAILRVEGECTDGELVQVRSSENEELGIGYRSAEGSIAIKMLSFTPKKIEQIFWTESIEQAINLRKTLGLVSTSETNAYRLINAEGDGLPGLIVDRYAKTVVIQCHSKGIKLRRQEIVTALRGCLGSEIETIFDKSVLDNTKETESRYLLGSSSNGEILENSLLFKIDWENGQKTGFFLDQRENRLLVKKLSKGRRVLNAFCYTGGFSVYALVGGAESVLAIDSSEQALELAKLNAALNGFDKNHQVEKADFLNYMQSLKQEFDLVILDPPAFAKNRKAIAPGLKGYTNINRRGFLAVRENGYLLTFSCSQLVSKDDFKKAVLDAALLSGRKVQIIAELRQANCHPVSLFHPEGDYLKGLLLFVK